jgi:hypothetical protein
VPATIAVDQYGNPLEQQLAGASVNFVLAQAVL